MFVVSADYATVEAVKRQLSSQFTEDGDDAFLVELVREASDLFALRTGRFFVPFKATYSVYIERGGDREVILPDLLALTSFTDVDAAGAEIALTADQYRLMPAYGHPKIAAFRVYGSWLYGFREDVVGTFGYHPDPDRMWEAETTLGAAIASASTTTVTVASTTGIETLDYLKVGDEILQATAVVDSTTLTVTRGLFGTTAATHLISAAVSVYRQYEPVRRAVILLAAHLYRTRANPGGESLSGPQGTFTITPNEPPLVERTIQTLIRRRVMLV